MARASKTGVRGLYGNAKDGYEIDLRWRTATGEKMRHREVLPPKTTHVVAKARAQSILDASKAGTYVTREEGERRDREASHSAFGEAFARYIDHLRIVKPRAAIDRQSQRERLVECIGERTKLGELDGAAVRGVIAKLRGEGLSAATGNRYLATIKHFAGWACETDKTMPAEVAYEVRRVPLTTEDNKRTREVHTDEETHFAELGGWLRPVVDLARVTGCRLGEITSLRWSQVDLAKKTITLTKTKAGRTREIPITPQVGEVLATVPRGVPAAFVLPIPLPPVRVGAKRTDELLRRRDHASGAFHDWTRERGIHDLRAHDLRHDYASRLHRSGTRLEIVGKLLGHSQPQTTLRYAHVNTPDLAREAANLPRVARSLPAEVRKAKG